MSRLTCPPQIQLQSRRTGAVLTRRMDTYKEVIFTKVASNPKNNDATTQNGHQDSPVLHRSNWKAEESWLGEWTLTKELPLQKLLPIIPFASLVAKAHLSPTDPTREHLSSTDPTAEQENRCSFDFENGHLQRSWHKLTPILHRFNKRLGRQVKSW